MVEFVSKPKYQSKEHILLLDASNANLEGRLQADSIPKILTGNEAYRVFQRVKRNGDPNNGIVSKTFLAKFIAGNGMECYGSQRQNAERE